MALMIACGRTIGKYGLQLAAYFVVFYWSLNVKVAAQAVPTHGYKAPEGRQLLSRRLHAPVVPTVQIGALLDLTDDGDLELQRGFNLAINRINANGGIRVGKQQLRADLGLSVSNTPATDLQAYRDGVSRKHIDPNSTFPVEWWFVSGNYCVYMRIGAFIKMRAAQGACGPTGSFTDEYNYAHGVVNSGDNIPSQKFQGLCGGNVHGVATLDVYIQNIDSASLSMVINPGHSCSRTLTLSIPAPPGSMDYWLGPSGDSRTSEMAAGVSAVNAKLLIASDSSQSSIFTNRNRVFGLLSPTDDLYTGSPLGILFGLLTSQASADTFQWIGEVNNTDT